MGNKKTTVSSKEEAAKRRMELAEKQHAAAKALQRKVTLGVIAGVLVLAVILGAVAVIGALRENGTTLRAKTVVESEHYSVNGCMMTYFVSTYYSSLKNSYQDDMKTYTGIDPDLPLREQEMGGKTAYDAVCDVVMTQVRTMLAMAEGARKAGIELSAVTESGIRTKAGTVKGMPTGVTEDDIASCMILAYLADQYETQVQNTAYTDDEVTAYAEADKYGSGAYVVDVSSYAFRYTAGNADSVARAKAFAEKLAACEDAEAFSALLPSVIMESNNLDEEAAKSEAQNGIVSGVVETDTAFCKWAFDGTRTDGDVTMIDDTENSMFGVYALLKAPYRTEERTVSFQQILFTPGVYGDDARAKKKAEDIYQQFLDGEKTDEAFATLASDNNFNSVDNNGLYENTYAGQVGDTLRTWYYAADRKPGDCTVVKGSNGYYVCYFIGEGRPRWYAATLSAMREKALSDEQSALKDEFLKAENTAVLASLPIGY